MTCGRNLPGASPTYVTCAMFAKHAGQTAALAQSPKKKEARFPAPLAMTNKVYFVFFLATAIAAYKRRSLHVVVSGARLSSLCWEIRGFAALPRDRCASSFSQSMARKDFYTGSNLNWCRLNLYREQGR